MVIHMVHESAFHAMEMVLQERRQTLLGKEKQQHVSGWVSSRNSRDVLQCQGRIAGDGEPLRKLARHIALRG